MPRLDFALMRYVLELKDGREIVMASGVSREAIENMLDDGDVLDEDHRHYLDVRRDALARVSELG